MRKARLTGSFRPFVLRQWNARELLALLRSNSPCSRADLVRLSGLSAPTVSSTIEALEKKNLVERLGLGTSNGGRRPDLLRFNSKYGFVAGVDIGGSNLRLVVADLDGTILGRWTANTRVHRTPAKIVDLIHDGLSDLLRQQGLSERNLLAIAAGAPGVTDVKRGIVISAPHLMNWESVPLRSLLETRFKVPAVVENDVNAAAVGERWRGAAQGVDDFVFLAIGTGIGAGIFIRAELYHGADWSAGEVGYLRVPGTRNTGVALDKPGALETLVGGHGIERAWRKACEATNGKTKLDHNLKPTEVFALAESGNAVANKILVESAQILSDAISNISVVLDSSLVVLGGGIGTSQPLFEEVRYLLENNEFACPRLAISILGEDAQLYGVLRLALDRVEESLFSTAK
jgi:predicted NBD/HSP70 family sugar kinase